MTRKANLAPVSISMRTMVPSLDTEKAVASSDVTAMAVTESLQRKQTTAHFCALMLLVCAGGFHWICASRPAHTLLSMHAGTRLPASAQMPDEVVLLRKAPSLGAAMHCSQELLHG